jgi:hypothetical protein
MRFYCNLKVSCAVVSVVSLAVVGYASFRLILLSLPRFVCVNCLFSTNLSSCLLPGCRLLLLLCCLVYVVCSAAWSVLLEKSLVSSYSGIFQRFMELEGSLPCSKKRATNHCPEPDQVILRAVTEFLWIGECPLLIICFTFVRIYLVCKISEIKIVQTVRIIHGFSPIKMIPWKYIFVRNFSTPSNDRCRPKTAATDCFNDFIMST